MKEATGELNMTVVTVVAIGAVMVFFYLIIWPTIQTGMALNSACNSAGNGKFEQTTSGGSISCDKGVCTFTDENNNATTKTCSE